MDQDSLSVPSSSQEPVPRDAAPVALPAAAVSEKPVEKGFLKRFSLPIAGALNLIGDASLLVAGYKNKDKWMTLAGGLYTGGALALTRYGKASSQRTVKNISEDTADFLKQQTGNLPEGTGLAAIDAQKPHNPLYKAEHYLYRHPADAMLGLYTAGAAAMIGSGIRQGNKLRVGYGLWSLLVKATSFLLPEKKKSEDGKKQSGGSGGIVDWIREKPLRLFGYGSMITELLLAASSYRDLKDRKAGAGFELATSGLYMLSDILMATSSKETSAVDGKLTAPQLEHIETLAAETIAKQPKAVQAKLVSEVSKFLAGQQAVPNKEADIQTGITKQLQKASGSTWAHRLAEDEVPAFEPSR